MDSLNRHRYTASNLSDVGTGRMVNSGDNRTAALPKDPDSGAGPTALSKFKHVLSSTPVEAEGQLATAAAS